MLEIGYTDVAKKIIENEAQAKIHLQNYKRNFLRKFPLCFGKDEAQIDIIEGFDHDNNKSAVWKITA
jgi:hypothetical protein